MTALADKLIETMIKDIEVLENEPTIDPKTLRKETNLLKSRLDSLEKFLTNQEILRNLKIKIANLLK